MLKEKISTEIDNNEGDKSCVWSNTCSDKYLCCNLCTKKKCEDRCLCDHNKCKYFIGIKEEPNKRRGSKGKSKVKRMEVIQLW